MKRTPVKKQRKIAVMGFRAVGKSTISLQFCEGHFTEAYNPTIENTFHKKITYSSEEYDLEIIDTAGQDEHSSFQPHLALGIHGYILVYSVTDRFSFGLVKTLNDKILNAIGQDKVPRVLVGNKIDLSNSREIPTTEGQTVANEWGCSFVECSAKQNTNISVVFISMIQEIEKVNPTNVNNQPSTSSDCVLI